MATPWAVGIFLQFGRKGDFRCSLCGVEASGFDGYLLRQLGEARRAFCFHLSESQTNP